MKNIKLNMRYAIIVLAALSFTACKKDKGYDPVGDRGQTIVKLVDGGIAGEIITGGSGHILTGIDFVPTPQSLTIADLRRDVPNSVELNRTMNVIVQADTFALRIYNDSLVAHGKNPLLEMPSSWYSFNYTPAANGTISFTLAPGEVAKQLILTIPDATLLDPASTYGFAFTIISADANGVISENRTMIYEVGAKNKYDGIYNLKGMHNRDPYTFPYETEMHLVTTSGTEVAFYWPEVGGVGHPIGVGPGEMSWYGAGIAPKIAFNPETDQVSNVYNGAGPGSTPIDIYTGAGSGAGRYDAATKTVYVYWRYNANDLRAFMDTLVYTGPR